jgi:hypothetical protein
MKLRKWSILLALFAICLLSAYAQSPAALPSAEADSVFAPFPSKLSVTVKEGIVVLGWIDSPDVKSGYAVYRSVEAIDAKSFSSAIRLSTVASGVMSYSDTSVGLGEYYYAVLALAEDGSAYPVFIPARNTTATSLAVESPAPAAGSPVSNLSALAKGDAVLVSYNAPPKSRLVLYRSASPIAKAVDLLDATLVAAFTDKDGSFADYPVPGVDYYYAVLGEEDLKSGNIALNLGVNSLKVPVQVRAAVLSSGFGETLPLSRTPPLPYFLVEDGAAGKAVAPLDEGPPPERAVAAETAKAIGVILVKAPNLTPSLPKAAVLEEEKAQPTGGEDYALSIIVSGKIATKDWPGAIDQLRKYLSLNRGPKVQARAHFYLGEALAFSGSRRDAFFEFLSARDFYPIETRPWIEYSLRTIESAD